MKYIVLLTQNQWYFKSSPFFLIKEIILNIYAFKNVKIIRTYKTVLLILDKHPISIMQPSVFLWVSCLKKLKKTELHKFSLSGEQTAVSVCP